MGVMLKISCFLLSVLGLARAGAIPEEKCKLDDSACLVSAFQKMIPVFMAGLPDVDVAVLDPMAMDDLSFDLAGLQFTLKEGRLKGLKGSVIDSVNWDTTKNILAVDYHMDASVKGHYTAGGRILILPITGDGQLKLKLKNLQIKLYFDYDLVKDADGKDHIKPKKYHFDFDVKDGAHYYLGNLFNGNKQLSDTMLAFLNENWKQITSEFGKPVMDVAANIIYKNVINYFDKTPIEDIAIV